jgi:hypothetical protein
MEKLCRDMLGYVVRLIYCLANFMLRTKTMIDHVDGVRRLRTTATNGLVVHPPGDKCAWRAVVVVVVVVTTTAGEYS